MALRVLGLALYLRCECQPKQEPKREELDRVDGSLTAVNDGLGHLSTRMDEHFGADMSKHTMTDQGTLPLR